MMDRLLSVNNILAFEIEVRGPGFDPPADTIVKAGEEVFAGMMALAKTQYSTSHLDVTVVLIIVGSILGVVFISIGIRCLWTRCGDVARYEEIAPNNTDDSVEEHDVKQSALKWKNDPTDVV